MNNWTGVNLLALPREFDVLISEIKKAHKFGEDSFKTFSEGLEKSWCSPNAYDYQGQVLKGNEIGIEIQKMTVTLLDTSIKAIHDFLSKQGYNFTYDYGNLDMYGYWCISLKKETPNGEVGMNKKAVTQLLYDYYRSLMELCEMLQSLPKNISVYDPFGQVESAFASFVTRITSKVTETAEEVVTTVKPLMEQEIDNINLGVSQAEEKLSS